MVDVIVESVTAMIMSVIIIFFVINLVFNRYYGAIQHMSMGRIAFGGFLLGVWSMLFSLAVLRSD